MLSSQHITRGDIFNVLVSGYIGLSSILVFLHASGYIGLSSILVLGRYVAGTTRLALS